MMCLTAQNNGSLADFVFAYVDIIGNVAIARIAESIFFFGCLFCQYNLLLKGKGPCSLPLKYL